MQQQYDAGVTDEFIEPVHFEGRPGIEPGDTVVFFNFRPDRARQLSQRLLEAGFDLTTMTRYRDDLDCPIVFEEQDVANTLAEVLAANGARQLHCAETEKYAHVTYFLNGGREEEWPGETRILVPSPREVGTYDKKPEMSAAEVAERFAAEIGDGYRFGIVNFANPDMVGHTGSIPAAIAACRGGRPCLGSRRSTRSSAPAASRSSPPTTATPRRCSRPTASARTRRTRPTPSPSSSRPEASSCATASSPTSRRLSSRCSGIAQPPEMTGHSLLRAG